MAFTCKFCSSTFTETTNLNRHIRTKHSNTSFNCERCDFTTKRKDKLKSHIESKHYGNKSKCPHCAFEATRKDNLTRHIKNYHEVSKDPLAPTPNFDWVEHIEQEEKREEKAMEEKTGEKSKQDEPEESEEKSAFNKRLVQKKWFIRGQKDILEVFKKYRKGVFHAVKLALKKNQLKADIVVKVRMFRQDKEGEKEEVSQSFYGGPRLILREEDFDEAYDESVKRIWRDFDGWLSNGSGWILERVENLYLNTAIYDPIYGSSYIKTPKSLEGKKAVVNPQNKDEQCFKWAVLAALHPAK